MSFNLYSLGTFRSLAVASLLTVFSCQMDHEQSAVTPADANLVSLQEAKLAAQHSGYSTIVQEAVEKIGHVPGKIGPTAGDRPLENVIVVPEQQHPSYYIINYKGGGYIILAADKRVEPILAYSETGHYQQRDKLPQALVRWLSTNSENMQRLRKNTVLKAPHNVVDMWQELLADAPKTTDSSKPMPPPEECQDRSSTYTKGPILATAWGQGCLYNDFCNPGTYSCNHVPTGCVATAMAQVMYHFKQPAATFQWSSMPTTSGSSSVAYLMHEVGLSVGMNYSDTGSGAPTQNVATALKNQYGYSSADYGNYDYNNLKNSLNANRPVVLQGFTDHHETGFLWWTTDHPSGDGHAWVCDGYQDNSWFMCECGCGGSYSMLHMNWGWNELWSSNNYNGWYREDNWTVVRTDATFHWQYFREMVYNIHP